ncbi:uncharacterized protein [Lolium perenne]|uniref:uncharacterized protein isoform X1 n=1 Tax=Lolium perenne TaxID=4522 RepID=UPI0021F54796|nr:uncharacterized protein LOC127333519 isoform X1 [Lolium perenne]
MAFLAPDMEQPARVSGAADRPPRSDQGDVPRSLAHASQVATSAVACRRFYLCLHQVCFQRQKAQQLFIPARHLSSRLQRYVEVLKQPPWSMPDAANPRGRLGPWPPLSLRAWHAAEPYAGPESLLLPERFLRQY